MRWTTRGSLSIDYDATSDAPTVVNLTNHALFDLAGEGSRYGIYDQKLTIAAHRFTPVNAALIPTGELRAVAGTVFDFTTARMLSDGIRDGRDPQIAIGHGWDHNFVLDKGLTTEPGLGGTRRGSGIGSRARGVDDPSPACNSIRAISSTDRWSGRRVMSTGWGTDWRLSRRNSPIRPTSPRSVTPAFSPGKPYHHRMIYRVSVAR